MKITEQDSLYENLHEKNILTILQEINTEDKKVAYCVEKAIPQIQKAVEAIYQNMKEGGRLFYIGAGTSGRLGIIDASECPPTFGVSHDLVIGIIAGGDSAIRKAVEGAEDHSEQAWLDLQNYSIHLKDSLIGISASGTTPYVIGGLSQAKSNGILTIGITNNLDTPLSKIVDFPIEVPVGPEYLTGSTRMKAGTAQKMILNMISTTLMIKLGHVLGNQMIDMQLTNQKLIHRAIQMLMKFTSLKEHEAFEYLKQYKNVRKAYLAWQNTHTSKT